MQPDIKTNATFTFNALIDHLQVGFQIFRTRIDGVQSLIRYPDSTLPPSGAHPVQVGEHVGGTAQVTIVTEDASAGAHSAITSVLYQNHFVLMALRRERLRLAVLYRIWKNTQTV